MTQETANRTVASMFKWMVESPIPYPIEEQRLKVSAIANIVLDSGSTEMSVAYHQEKLRRGMDNAWWGR